MITRTRKEVYQLWLEALRSGKFEQDTGQLCYDNKFCCLGVLCQLAVEDGGKPYGKSDGFPPIEFLEFMGFTEIDDTESRLIAKQEFPRTIIDEDEIVTENKVIRKLVDMNDYQGKSFKQIARYIEKSIMPKVCQ